MTWEKLSVSVGNFSMQKSNSKFGLKLYSPSVRKLQGKLIKLNIDCVRPKPQDDDEGLSSCTIFKFLGKRKYTADITVPPTYTTRKSTSRTSHVTDIVTTTKDSYIIHTTSPTPRSKIVRSTLIIIIIAVGATLFVVLLGILLWCCCWKKRKGDRGQSLLSRNSDANYQNPNSFPGPRPSTHGGSANNLTYLQPIDAMSNSSKQKFQSVMMQDVSMKSLNGRPKQEEEKQPIYAEVSDVRPSPSSSTYSAPSISRGPPSSVVGVPGYQLPAGVPGSDTSSRGEYSALSVVGSNGDSTYQTLLGDQQPQYAEVVPDDYAVSSSLKI